MLTRIFLPYGCRSCYNLWQKFPRTSSGCVIVEAFSESSQYDPFFWHCWLFEKKKCNLNPFLTIPCWVSLYALFSSCTITKDHHRLRIVRNSGGKNCILRNYFSKKGLLFSHKFHILDTSKEFKQWDDHITRARTRCKKFLYLFFLPENVRLYHRIVYHRKKILKNIHRSCKNF